MKRYLWVGGSPPLELVEYWMAKEFHIPPHVLRDLPFELPFIFLAIQRAIQEVAEMDQALSGGATPLVA